MLWLCKVTLASEERLLGLLVCFVLWLYISCAAFEVILLKDMNGVSSSCLLLKYATDAQRK